MAHVTGKTFALAHLEDRLFSLGTPQTANVGGTQFVYLSYNGDGTGGKVGIYSAAANGALTFLADIPATPENGLSGAWEMETFTIGDTTFLAVAAQRADSISIFAASDTAPYLTHVDSVFDSENALYELDSARYLSVHQVGGNTFITATSVRWFGDTTFDDGITVFRVADDGTLSFASVLDSEAGVGNSSGWPSDTFEVGGNHYFALGRSYDGPGFAIIQIDPDTGVLQAVAPSVGADLQRFFQATQIDVHVVDDVPYLFVPTRAGTLYVFTYEGGSDAVLLTSISLPEGYPPEPTAVYGAGDNIIVAIGSNSRNGDGVLLYEFDVASRTISELQWMHGSQSTEPDAQPLQDVSFGPTFTIDGQPFALITSDDDNGLNVYAIGGNDDVLTGTAEADLIEGFGGNDTLNGLAGDDMLVGGADDDILNGGADFDTARFLNASTDYDIVHDAVSGSYTVTALLAGSLEGSDTLNDVEAVAFSDGTFALTPDGLSPLSPDGLNQTPVAVNDTADAVRNGSVDIAVLANDSDPDASDTLTLTRILSGPAAGTAAIAAGGIVTYTPVMTWFGTDTFTYEISDAAGETATASVTVDVAGPAGLTAGPVTFDVAGTKFRDAEFDIFNASGQKVGATIVYDDGRLHEITFANGVQASLTQTDTANVYPWAERTQTFDAGGVLAAQTTLFDDGQVSETGYTNGVRTSLVQIDVTGVESWSRITQTWDTDGNKLTSTLVRDNGVTEVSQFTDESATTIVQTDTADRFVWNEKAFDLAPSGAITAQTTLMDDGRIFETGFTDGVQTSLVQIDANGDFNWSRITQTWDIDGNRLSSVLERDNGVTEQTRFDADGTSRTVQTDTADLFVWAERTNTFDATNTLTTQSTVTDDGRLFEIDFVNGVRSSGVVTDVDNAYSWLTQTMSYDASGVLTGLVITQDPDVIA